MAASFHHKRLTLFCALHQTLFLCFSFFEHTVAAERDFPIPHKLPVLKPKNVAHFFRSVSAHVDDKLETSGRDSESYFPTCRQA